MFSKKTNKYVIPLLYITPTKFEKEVPVNDELTLGMEKVFNTIYNKDHKGVFSKGIFDYGPNWLGFHRCACGELSGANDYIIHVSPTLDLEGDIQDIRCLLKMFDVVVSEESTKQSIVDNNPLNYATNTLCIHYLRYHRSEIPKKELDKVATLLRLYFK